MEKVQRSFAFRLVLYHPPHGPRAARVSCRSHDYDLYDFDSFSFRPVVSS